MFSHPKILFLVSLLFVALLNSIPTYLLNFFKFFYHSIKYSIKFSIIQATKPGISTRANRIKACMRFQAYTTNALHSCAGAGNIQPCLQSLDWTSGLTLKLNFSTIPSILGLFIYSLPFNAVLLVHFN